MKSRLPVLLALVVLVFLVGVFWAVRHKSSENSENTSGRQAIRIGAILPLTGDAAPYGTSLRKGLDLAVRKVNSEDYIPGHFIDIRYEDDQNLSKAGVLAFNKLLTIDRVVAVIGPMFSSVALAVAPVAERNHVTLLSPTASAIEYTAAGDYAFRIYPSDSYDGSYLAAFARKDLKANSAAILSLQSPSTQSISQLFADLFKADGGIVLDSSEFAAGTSDFKTTLTKLKAHQPDVVLLASTLNEAATILRQAREIGFGAQFLGISTLFDPSLIDLAQNAADGVLFSSPTYDPGSDDSLMIDFVARFQAEHQTQPDILAAYGYDGGLVAAEAIRRALGQGRVDSNSIRDALYTIENFEGVTGSMSFDKNGDVEKALRIMEIADGQFRPFRHREN